MRATCVFLDSHTASRTPSHVVCKSEAGEGPALLIVAPTTLVPWLLALEAGELLAVLALNLTLSFALPRDVFLALEIWAPDSIFVHVDLARKTKSLQSSVFFLA